VETLAREMKVSRSRLFVLALEDYLRGMRIFNYSKELTKPTPMHRCHRAKAPAQDPSPASQSRGGHLVINQGDIFWVELDEPTGSGPGYRHPHVVIRTTFSIAAASIPSWSVR